MNDLENITEPENPETHLDEGDVIPVKVRESVRDSIRRAAEDARNAPDDPFDEKPKRSDSNPSIRLSIPPQYRRAPRPAPASTTDDERMWAAIAHGSAFLTIILALLTGGLASLLTVFIPLGIYFAHRDKSEFVAHHALQAFAAQVVGTIGFMVLLITISITWAVLLLVSAILVFVLVGLILLPVVLLAGLVAIAATFLLPLGLLVYSMIAAIQAWNGSTYRYPWIGDWVDGQLFETV